MYNIDIPRGKDDAHEKHDVSDTHSGHRERPNVHYRTMLTLNWDYE